MSFENRLQGQEQNLYPAASCPKIRGKRGVSPACNQSKAVLGISLARRSNNLNFRATLVTYPLPSLASTSDPKITPPPQKTSSPTIKPPPQKANAPEVTLPPKQNTTPFKTSISKDDISKATSFTKVYKPKVASQSSDGSKVTTSTSCTSKYCLHYYWWI